MKCRQMKVEEEEQKSGKLGIAEGTGGFCPAPAEMRGSGGHWAHTGASRPSLPANGTNRGRRYARKTNQYQTGCRYHIYQGNLD